MLAIRRKVGESIFITLPDGRRGEIKLGDVNGSKTHWKNANINLDFPDDVTIHREEIQRSIDNYSEH